MLNVPVLSTWQYPFNEHYRDAGKIWYETWKGKGGGQTVLHGGSGIWTSPLSMARISTVVPVGYHSRHRARKVGGMYKGW